LSVTRIKELASTRGRAHAQRSLGYRRKNDVAACPVKHRLQTLIALQEFCLRRYDIRRQFVLLFTGRRTTGDKAGNQQRS
jgi:hypothetical protein